MAKDYYPPMHSAEHILNQTIVRMFNCGRSVNAHIEKKKSRIDYRIPRELTANEVAEIERRVNEVIDADLKVDADFIPRSDAEKQFNHSKLPDEVGDPLRIIRIGDYDSCPCIGTHVANTKEIGRFKILSTTCENGIVRLRFKLDRPGEK